MNGNINMNTNSIVNAAWVNTTNIYASGTIYGNIQGTITPTGNINMQGYSIYNAYDVNATRFFQNGVQVINTVNAGNGLIGGGSGPSVNLDVNVNTAKGLQIVSDALETKIGTGLNYDASGNIYVVYGSSAGTAVQGNTQLTINTGTGLTGGATITLGSGGTVNLGIDNGVVPFKGNNEQISGSWTFLNDLTVMKNLRVAGNITYVNAQTLNVNGSLVPPLDNWFDIGNSSNRWRNASFAGSVNTNNLVVSGYVNSNLIPGSDNSYNLGSSSNRWANVYAVNVYASNINGGTPITGSGSTNYVAKFTGSNSLGNSIIYDNGTNVGIVTSNPQAKLDVVGNQVVGNSGALPNGVVAELHIGRQLAGAGTVGEVTRIALQPYGHTGGPFKIVNRDDASNAYLDLRYGSSNLLTIIHNGNIGIGTTSPNYKLTVSGGDIYGSNNLYVAGNVGIGTMSPGAKLDVVGNMLISGDIAQQRLGVGITGTADIGIQLLNYGRKHAGIRFTGNQLIVEDASSTNVPSTWYSGSALDFIVRNGNVGIGTTAPYAKLDVRGGVSWGSSVQNLLQEDQGGSIELGGRNDLANPVSGGMPYIDFHYGTGSAQDYNFRIINSANNRLDFASAGQGTFVSFNSGNVGIGTTTIDAGTKLQVEGGIISIKSSGDARIQFTQLSSNEVGWIGIPSWSNHRLYIYGPNGTGGNEWVMFYDGSNKQLGFATGATQRMTIDSSGNVGIGTTTPSEKLEVYGNIKLSGTNNYINIAGSYIRKAGSSIVISDV
jgi:hypothetical protein